MLNLFELLFKIFPFQRSWRGQVKEQTVFSQKRVGCLRNFLGNQIFYPPDSLNTIRVEVGPGLPHLNENALRRPLGDSLLVTVYFFADWRSEPHKWNLPFSNMHVDLRGKLERYSLLKYSGERLCILSKGFWESNCHKPNVPC